MKLPGGLMSCRTFLMVVALAASIDMAHTQSAAPLPQGPGETPLKSEKAELPAVKPSEPARMDKLADHYVEGPGYVTFFHKQTKGYAGTYVECEKYCLADTRCTMIEFYKPLRKCHLYDHAKWSGKAKDADLALKIGR
jgi:PAN domain